MDRSERLLTIALKLQPGAWRRAEDLAEMFGVSVRTIYRDMELLEEAGMPVSAVRGKGYRLDEGPPPVTFTSEEASALLRGCDVVARQGTPEDRVAAERAEAKIERVLPARLREQLARQRQAEAARPVNIFDDPHERDLLAPLHEALEAQTAVRFRYAGARQAEATHLTVHPYGLASYGGVRHLVGSRQPEGSVQAFRLNAMRDLELTAETFERPKGYQSTVRARSAHRDVAVRVRFGGEAARWVQEALPSFTEEVEPVADGVILTLRVQREAEALPWLLSWGAYAHVLAPASLQRRLGREAQRMAAHYREMPTLL